MGTKLVAVEDMSALFRPAIVRARSPSTTPNDPLFAQRPFSGPLGFSAVEVFVWANGATVEVLVKLTFSEADTIEIGPCPFAGRLAAPASAAEFAPGFTVVFPGISCPGEFAGDVGNAMPELPVRENGIA